MKNKYCAEIKISKRDKSSKKTQKIFWFFLCLFLFLLQNTIFQKLFLYCCNFRDFFGFLSTFSFCIPKKTFLYRKKPLCSPKFFVSPKKFFASRKKPLCLPKSLIPKKVFCISKKVIVSQFFVSQNKHHLRGTLYPPRSLLYQLLYLLREREQELRINRANDRDHHHQIHNLFTQILTSVQMSIPQL